MGQKFAAVCFAILSLTLFLAALGTFGAFVLMFFYYPEPSTLHIAVILAVNSVLALFLAVLCAFSAWKLFRHRPKARSFSKVIWLLVACFTLWILIFDATHGRSIGGIVEVITWTFFEVLILIYLTRTKQEASA